MGRGRESEHLDRESSPLCSVIIYTTFGVNSRGIIIIVYPYVQPKGDNRCSEALGSFNRLTDSGHIIIIYTMLVIKHHLNVPSLSQIIARVQCQELTN